MWQKQNWKTVFSDSVKMKYDWMFNIVMCSYRLASWLHRPKSNKLWCEEQRESEAGPQDTVSAASVLQTCGALPNSTIYLALHFEDHSGLLWIRWGQVNVPRPKLPAELTERWTGAEDSRA